MGGEETLGISKVGPTVLARLMEFRFGTRLLALWGKTQKRDSASACPDARHFDPSLRASGTLQAATTVLELGGCRSE